MPRPALVSVVIPVFNGEKYLGEAIESVLVQSYSPLELIIVDDGSTDRSAEIARSFEKQHPVRLLQQENQGLGASRNRGVEVSSGELLSFLDADDLWNADNLKIQMAEFESLPELEVVFGHARQFISPELGRAEMRSYRAIDQAVPARLVTAMLARRSLMTRVGPFKEGIPLSDHEWIMRLDDFNVKSRITDLVVLRRRIHLTNLSHSSEKKGYHLQLSLLRDRLRRRRGRTSRGDHESPDHSR